MWLILSQVQNSKFYAVMARPVTGVRLPVHRTRTCRRRPESLRPHGHKCCDPRSHGHWRDRRVAPVTAKAAYPVRLDGRCLQFADEQSDLPEDALMGGMALIMLLNVGN